VNQLLHKSSLVFCIVSQMTLLHACSEDNGDLRKPYEARIVAFTPDGYRLQTVSIASLENPDNLGNTLVDFLGNAALDGEAEIDEIIDPSKKDSIYIDKGQPIRLDYQGRNGVIHPRNFDSMALLSLLYNYEKTMTFWQEQMDLSFDDFGKLRLFYAPRIKVRGRMGTIENTSKVNAAFLPGPRDLLFFRTARIEEIPINMNLGVLAHEFSHAIFDYRFADKDATVYMLGSERNQDELRGINEGIADYFSYIVTNRVEDFGDSLSVLGKYRTLPVAWSYSELSGSDCPESPYCKGSILASALFDIAAADGQSPVDVAKIVYDALPLLRTSWLEHANDIDFDYHYLIKHIISLAPAEAKNTYCESFKRWFDVSTVSTRIGC